MKKNLIFLLVFVPIFVFSQSNGVVSDTHDSLTLRVYVPTIDTRTCDYFQMLHTSFNHYFVEGLAFANKKECRVKVEMYVRDIDQKFNLSAANLPKTSISIQVDQFKYLFEQNQIAIPRTPSADATVVLLDGQQKEIYRDINYRAQGEHLKVLEAKVKEALGIKQPLTPFTFSGTLKIGDIAPNVALTDKVKLADLKGKVVVLSFYPAAFSGNKETPNPFDLHKTLMISCIGQIGLLDVIKIPTYVGAMQLNEAEIYAITSSTEPLLQLWRISLSTIKVKYINDLDYTISKMYHSYNPDGYNKRYTYVIGKTGKIAFIDAAFYFGDESKIQEVIQREMKK